jgi:hypothetical protein
VLDPGGIVIVSGANVTDVDDIDFDGTNYFLVLQTGIPPNNSIAAILVDQTGTALDSPVTIAKPTGTWLGYARTAFDVEDHLVTWEDTGTNTTYARRVSMAGALVDTAPLTINVNAVSSAPALGAGSGVFLVVFDRYSPTDIGLARRVSAAGAFLDAAPFQLSTSANDGLAPSVACNAGACNACSVAASARPRTRVISRAPATLATAPAPAPPRPTVPPATMRTRTP